MICTGRGFKLATNVLPTLNMPKKSFAREEVPRKEPVRNNRIKNRNTAYYKKLVICSNKNIHLLINMYLRFIVYAYSNILRLHCMYFFRL